MLYKTELSMLKSRQQQKEPCQSIMFQKWENRTSRL